MAVAKPGRGDLTEQEEANVRAAIRFLRLRVGDWETLAKVIRFSKDTVRHVIEDGRPVTPTMAFRVARIAQVPIDDLLTGKYPAPGTCPHCGHRREGAEAAR